MNKIQIAKKTVNLMTSITVGAVTGNIIKSNRNHSDNLAIELSLDAATVVTSYAVSDMLSIPVKRYTDEKIDAAVAWFQNRTNKTA